MKQSKLGLFGILFGLFLMASCGDDDSTPEPLNAAPIFGGDFFTISESVIDGAAIGMLSATDAEGDAITFSITAGNPAGNPFSIDGNNLVVSSASALNFDGANIELTVQASDGTNDVTGIVGIALDATANMAPAFIGGSFSVVEGTEAGIEIGTLMASEPEGESISFSIQDGNDGDAFALSEAGVLTVATADAINFDAEGFDGSFELTVRVSDGENDVDALVVIAVENDPSDDGAILFEVTLYNSINYLNSIVFNTPDGAETPGPLNVVDASYTIEFQAVPGTLLSFATMSVATNDWFYAPQGGGLALFENGQPVEGDITSRISLYDSGTEEEDPATEQINAPENADNPNGTPDDNPLVRRIRTDVTDEISVNLVYTEATTPETAGTFTLTITNELFDGMNPDGESPIVLSPGVVLLHAQRFALFQTGVEDYDQGLADIAEFGGTSRLDGFYNEMSVNDTPAPLRLSATYSNFSDGVGYTFFPGNDPYYLQGSPVFDNGLEAIAEDGSAVLSQETLAAQGANIVSPTASNGFPVRPGESMTWSIVALPGQTFGFATMQISSNDWFIAANNGQGIALFNEDGTPFSGIGNSSNTYLYDAGTEVDQPIGLGVDQPGRQAGPNTGDADADVNVRRVGAMTPAQFGLPTVNSGPGVTYGGTYFVDGQMIQSHDPRGGYNMCIIEVRPIRAM